MDLYLAARERQEQGVPVEPYRHTGMLFQEKASADATPAEKKIFEVSAFLRRELLLGYFGLYGRSSIQWSDEILADRKITDKLHDKLSGISGYIYPYADYFRGILQSGRDSSQFLACQQLCRAAQSGVTAAAFELLLLCLREGTRPLPLCVPLQLMRLCFSYPGGGIYLAHIHYRSQSLPPDTADAIVSTLACYLDRRPGPAHWRAAGAALARLAEELDSCERERCLVIAAFALHTGHDPELADKCRVGQKRLRQLLAHQAFDWLVVRSMAGTQNLKLSQVSEACRAWLPCRIFASLLDQDSARLNALLGSIDEGTDTFFLEWVSLCLTDPSGLASIDMPQGLKRFWQERQVLAPGVLVASTLESMEVPFLRVLHAPLPPLGSRTLLTVMEASTEENRKRMMDQWCDMDAALLTKLRDNRSEPDGEGPLSVVDKSIAVTVMALKVLGAVENPCASGGRRTINIPSVGRPHCRTALEILRPAVYEYANPYACWLCARLHRSGLLAARSCPGGEQLWKDHYLGLLLYAAVAGVQQAAEDLLTEFWSGRADCVLPTLVHLVRRWPQFRLRLDLKLQMTGPTEWVEIGDLYQFSGALEAISWIMHTDNCGHRFLSAATRASRQTGLRMTLLGVALTAFASADQHWNRLLEQEKKARTPVSLDLQLSMLHLVTEAPCYSLAMKTLLTGYMVPVLQDVLEIWPFGKRQSDALHIREPVQEHVWLQILSGLQWHPPEFAIEALRDFAKRQVSRKHWQACVTPARQTMTELVNTLLFLNNIESARLSAGKKTQRPEQLPPGICLPCISL